ncbi:MAG: sugar-binding domain-containing protein [Pyrinomonadaceae bacterium]
MTFKSPRDARRKSPQGAKRIGACAALVLLCALCALPARAQSVKLDSGWQFLTDPAGAMKVSDLNGARGWRDVRVGLSWNAQFADLRDYMGAAWYRTTLPATDLAGGKRALLRFGACDYYAEVFVNGHKVGQHEGGYTPFTFDVTDALRAGANELAVRVVDPPMDERENRARFPQMLYNEIPHGKQNWYVQTGGLWQPVWLETRPKLYVEQVHITTRSNGDFNVAIELNSAVKTDGTPRLNHAALLWRTAQASYLTQPLVNLRITVRDPKGQPVFSKNLLTKNNGEHIYSGRIPTPVPWSPDNPALYTAEVALVQTIENKGLVGTGESQQTINEKFGFRTFEARDGKFYLNGEPFYMRAALDQDFYPETIYTPPSKEYVRAQMLKGKQMGLNLLRCHIKVCSPEYLEAADEVGMLVWYEVPSWNDEHHFAEVAARRGEKVFDEMVERDWNHPAIVIQSIINEGWGADLPKGGESRRWLRAEFDRTKKLTAPLGRLIVDNSACCDNFHLKTDIEDNHRYNSIPDYYRDFDRWVADFAARPKWDFSPHGDAEPSGREPLVVSEFGNWGLPQLPKDLPWWFGRDFGGRPVTRPAGLFDRFAEFRLAAIFGDYRALAEATEWHQFISLKHEIEEIRRHASIQGYVITEFTDINWEANGLMSMWREPKAYAAELAKLQQDDLVIVRTDKHNYTSGEPVNFEVLLSHYGARDLSGAQLRWRTRAGKRVAWRKIETAVAPASVTPVARLTIPAPQVTVAAAQGFRVELRDAADHVLAENTADIFVYPKPAPAIQTALAFRDPSHALGLKEAQLKAAGYTLVGADGDARALNRPTLLVTSVLDDTVARHLRGGGRALLLADSKDALPKNSPLKVTPREGSDLDGNWVTNFNWVRAAAPSPFAGLAFTKIMGFESEHVVPRFVVQGVPGASFDDVLAGVFYGWLNNNAALAVQARAGAGRLVVTTLRFDEYGREPYATHLLDALIAYASGAQIAPKLTLDVGSATATSR